MKLNKWKNYYIVCAIAVFLSPILIVHILSKMQAPNEWFIASWNPGELLNYCGSLISSVSTIAAIIITIKFTEKNQRDERKLTVRPCLYSEYQPVYDFEKLKSLNNKKTVFISYPLYENNTESIGSSYELPSWLIKPSSNSNMLNILSDLEFHRKYYIMQYTISNVGAGNALNVELKVNDNIALFPFTLVVNSSIVLVIILSEKLVKDTSRKLFFSFIYNDVASLASYEQHETITLFKEKDGSLNTSIHISNVLSAPKEV